VSALRGAATRQPVSQTCARAMPGWAQRTVHSATMHTSSSQVMMCLIFDFEFGQICRTIPCIARLELAH
jgi:hypothetical protein